MLANRVEKPICSKVEPAKLDPIGMDRRLDFEDAAIKQGA